ncbi:MAG: ATP-dependent Clp protease ATP-binding subunit [Deltaproteobacteria bacterium]|nr:ATP-dependent Clp protease ATP-binding subunit [Deltaproteobacteria bacterium]
MRPNLLANRPPPAPDLARALTEARAIADGVGRTLSTTHVLLSLFTVPNPAELVLREHGVDEDKLLALVEPGTEEPAAVLRQVLDLADETALRCDARQTHTLHLLVAVLKVREARAYALLERALGNTGPLRNRALAFVTGVLPRRLLQPIHEANRLEPPAPPPARPRAPTGHVRGGDWVVPKKTTIDGDAAGSAASVVEQVAAEAAPAPDPAPAPRAERTGADEPPRPPPRKDEARRRPEAAIPAQATMPPTDWDLDVERFPWLTALGRNLNAVAANGGLDPSVGRARELEQLIDVLGKRRANNPCLVGEPGVGKTAIVEGLAVRIVRADLDVAPLFGKTIIELDMGRIVAGTSLRGSFSERMQGIKRDVQRAKGQIIVFIDEIHTLMGAGSTGDGPQDAANELKAALARGDFPCIGSTTHDEYRKHVEQDPALERRFVKIVVDEPDDAAALEIVRGAAPLYERHHQLTTDDSARFAAVQLSSRFLHEKRLPAKALDLLDLAMSRARRAGKKVVSREDVARVCADVAKIPAERVLLEDTKRFIEMETFLERHVVGHKDIIARVSNTIRRNYAGFTTHRPLGSFLFLGPSGVGKTELAKALADFLFGSQKALIRLDMSEYSEPHTVARLVGAPPGYVGFQDGGQLTEAVRARPHAVVLLDEVEKAHPDVLPILLQILDEGRLTDARGRTVTFRHALVVLTSNLGAAAAAQRARPMGFGAPSTIRPEEARLSAKQIEAVLDAARKSVPAELWGRIEDKMVFSPLGRAELIEIARLLLGLSSSALETTRNIALRFDDEVLGHLVDQGSFDAATGARPMRQLIQRLVESPVSDAILRGEVAEGARIRLQVSGGKLLARATRAERRAEAP